jgi:adenylate kinase family enzyme
MKKVLVIGPGGAGKSTFAQQLGRLLKIEVLHLDRFYWHSGWVETPKSEWSKKVEQLLSRDAWIMDGNYSGTLEQRVQASDTIIFLDLPPMLCLWRVMKRAAKYRNMNRPDMSEGCNERLTLEFILWIWNYRRRSRPKVLKLLESGAGKRIVRLRSPAEVTQFLARIAGDRMSTG